MTLSSGQSGTSFAVRHHSEGGASKEPAQRKPTTPVGGFSIMGFIEKRQI